MKMGDCNLMLRVIYYNVLVLNATESFQKDFELPFYGTILRCFCKPSCEMLQQNIILLKSITHSKFENLSKQNKK